MTEQALRALADNILSGQDPADVSPKAVALAAMVHDWFAAYDRDVADFYAAINALPSEVD